MPASLGEDVQHVISAGNGVPLCQMPEGALFFGLMFEKGKFELQLCPECEAIFESLKEVMS